MWNSADSSSGQLLLEHLPALLEMPKGRRRRIVPSLRMRYLAITDLITPSQFASNAIVGIDKADHVVNLSVEPGQPQARLQGSCLALIRPHPRFVEFAGG